MSERSSFTPESNEGADEVSASDPPRRTIVTLLCASVSSILYTAVIRGKVALPCDITPPSADDTVALVLWYKDEGPAPIYTLDARRGHVDQARQSAVSELGARAYFNMMNRPAFLQLDPVEEEDAGEYRCRVDFRKARSVNTVINLKVIAFPFRYESSKFTRDHDSSASVRSGRWKQQQQQPHHSSKYTENTSISLTPLYARPKSLPDEFQLDIDLSSIACPFL
ncbi:hypothetical protein HPB51_015168 [Rhipicephalus microplus]|uniref:Ig-like domain-containing protein n=1 Tax=Rhipicephalus microplus TaxID=6941 RepID=A0A9J6DP38_RHIMP|nr:hypothetical protein HPB51_015168 [Rhipicephalus microplus]